MFAIKAHQLITHIKRLANVEDAMPGFIDSLRPLAEAHRLGPVLFQTPPNLKADSALLDSFLKLLPHAAELRPAFEFRHASWFADEIYDVLKRYNAALCVAEAEGLIVPEVATAGFIYYRFRNPPYPPEGLQNIRDRIRGHLDAARDVYAFFKHEDLPEGALCAESVLKQFRAASAE
jgi:uncharacterized protein YecE (DUF72 family)